MACPARRRSMICGISSTSRPRAATGRSTRGFVLENRGRRKGGPCKSPGRLHHRLGLNLLGGRQWQRKYLEGPGISAFQFRVPHEFDFPFHPVDRAPHRDGRGGRVQTLLDDGDRRSVSVDVYFIEATRGILREQKDVA